MARVRPTRKPKESHKSGWRTVLFAIRLTPLELHRLDRYAVAASRVVSGLEVNRSAAVRKAIAIGLDALEAELRQARRKLGR